VDINAELEELETAALKEVGLLLDRSARLMEIQRETREAEQRLQGYRKRIAKLKGQSADDIHARTD